MVDIKSAKWLNPEHTEARCIVFLDILGDYGPYSVREDFLDTPFAVELWEALKTFPVDEFQAPSPEVNIMSMRCRRDELLLNTDVFMLVDYSISQQDRSLIAQYRDYLRNLTDTPEWYKHPIMTLDQWISENI